MRALGAGGLSVSLLGLGTAALGRNEGLSYSVRPALPSDRAIGRFIGTARDLGVTLIDTAPAYGTAEARLGRHLAGDRERWVIATKAGERFLRGRSVHDFSRAALARQPSASGAA